MLYPRESETREVKDLSGIWEFKIDKNERGFKEKWFCFPLKDTIKMPVPSSYNEITQDPEIRDHIGWVWYETNFFIPQRWNENRIFIRFGSVTHKAIVWLNGKECAKHIGGFLPFESEITNIVKLGEDNRLTVAVNNILDWSILPSGEIKEFKDEYHPKGYKVQEIYFDFFNYAGIHRPVKVIALPKTFIQDIKIITEVKNNKGIISYEIEINGNDKVEVEIELYDKDSKKVLNYKGGTKGRLELVNPNLWEPLSPYLYKFWVKLIDNNKNIVDIYRLPIGIRTVKVTKTQFLINGKPFYFKGFGKHEDSDIRGKGLDNVINIKDFNILKWIGANSFRTSHYPYSEEIMNLADEEGIVIIDEVPAVGMNLWNPKEKVFTNKRVNEKTLEHHLQCIRELIKRDKNHPSVVMWSVANEAATYEKNSVKYFKKIVDEVRKLDKTRPVTIVNSTLPDKCRVSKFFDVICVNRYWGWYSDPGKLDLIEYQMSLELDKWFKRFKKPILVTEFGADTIAGFHKYPPVMFSEEFQVEFLNCYFKAIDKKNFVIGEHIWCFADFATKQAITRVIGNRKGIFTRQREPKQAAFFIKKRWCEIK